MADSKPNANTCPSCGQQSGSDRNPQYHCFTDQWASLATYCTQCGACWTAVYRWEGVEDVEDPGEDRAHPALAQPFVPIWDRP